MAVDWKSYKSNGSAVSHTVSTESKMLMHVSLYNTDTVGCWMLLYNGDPSTTTDDPLPFYAPAGGGTVNNPMRLLFPDGIFIKIGQTIDGATAMTTGKVRYGVAYA